MLKIKVVNKVGNEMYIGQSSDKICAIFNFAYEDGDWMIIDSDKKGGFYKIQLEDTMQESIIYVPGSFFIYHIPLKDKRSNYSPKSFYGDCHIIKVEEASKEEIKQRRNLAFNPYDEHGNDTFFPHSSANILFSLPKDIAESFCKGDGLIQNEYGLGSPQSKNQRAITGEMIKEICIPIQVDRLGNITNKLL